MTLHNFNIDELKNTMFKNQNPYKVLYQWVKTGHVSFGEFKELVDMIVVERYNKQQQSKVDVGNPDQFI